MMMMMLMLMPPPPLLLLLPQLCKSRRPDGQPRAQTLSGWNP
jgi:hypothetical protein